MTAPSTDYVPGSWIAASTHVCRERVAIVNLERQGFSTYCPMLRKRIRHARRQRDVLRPMFPGYVFICLEFERIAWRPILSTAGVRTLIRFGDRLGTLPAQFIEALRAHEHDGAVSLPPSKKLTPGERVRITTGPLEGLIATVIRADDPKRLLVLMELLSRSVRVVVPTHAVAPQLQLR
jgi:transcription elongation factor/antiterminator RfaH